MNSFSFYIALCSDTVSGCQDTRLVSRRINILELPSCSCPMHVRTLVSSPQGRSPKVLPQKKKKNLKRIKILPQNLLFFLILAPPNFFFQFGPPNFGGLAPPLPVRVLCLSGHDIQGVNFHSLELAS
jgi:hypothetical protein